MSKIALGVILLAASAYAAPVHLRTNAMDNPLGVDTPKPTFAWRSDATAPNWKQSAYEVLVATDALHLEPGRADAWDSGQG